MRSKPWNSFSRMKEELDKGWCKYIYCSYYVKSLHVIMKKTYVTSLRTNFLSRLLVGPTSSSNTFHVSWLRGLDVDHWMNPRAEDEMTLSYCDTSSVGNLSWLIWGRLIQMVILNSSSTWFKLYFFSREFCFTY